MHEAQCMFFLVLEFHRYLWQYAVKRGFWSRANVKAAKPL